MTLEKSIVKNIKKMIEREYPDSFIFKTHGGPFQRAGIPDLIGCINGRFVAIEVKQPGKKATKLQEYTLGLIKKAGGISFVSDDKDYTIKVLKKELRR